MGQRQWILAEQLSKYQLKVHKEVKGTTQWSDMTTDNQCMCVALCTIINIFHTFRSTK